MNKKILYALGVLFLFILLVSNFPSEPKEETVQNDFVPNEIATITNTEIKSVTTTTKSTAPIVIVKSVSTSTKIRDEKQYYSVSSVVDGDTIKINNDGTIETLRLIGMDTPETVDPRKPVQCFGLEASNKAKELLSGKKVYLEKDLSQGEFDKYGRILAYIYREDGLFYNEYMIKQGYAHEYTYNAPYKYQDQFKADQKYAQDNKLGLWSSDTCSEDTSALTPELTQTISIPTNTGTIYYTSSYSTSKYYYPESCYGWKSLSPKYLKSFNSLEELLSAYPNRTKSSTCN